LSYFIAPVRIRLSFLVSRSSFLVSVFVKKQCKGSVQASLLCSFLSLISESGNEGMRNDICTQFVRREGTGEITNRAVGEGGEEKGQWKEGGERREEAHNIHVCWTSRRMDREKE
jgi:hypothetical protein